MLRDRDANVWLGTTEGLVRVGPDGTVVFDREAAHARVGVTAGVTGGLTAGVTGGPVTALFEDREGSLWIGGAAGIARLRQGGFTAYAGAEGLPADHVGPVHVDAAGRTWFAPVQGGLYWLQQGRVERVTAAGLDRDIVYTIAGGGDEVWVGRKQGGLTRLRVAGGAGGAGGIVQAATFTPEQGLARGSVVALHRSHDGTIWAGTLGAGASAGRANADGIGFSSFSTYTAANGLASNNVTSIAETSDGTVWFATPQGLSAYAGGRWRTYGVSEGLPSGAVNCVLGDGRDDSLWVGTAAGLVRIAEDRVVANPLPPILREQIFGLAEDNKGSLWVATSNRLVQVSIDRLRSGQLGEGDIREFDDADGLRSVESTRRERSLIQSPDGRIWLSTTRGLAVVDPARLPPRMPASAGVRAISVDGEALGLPGAAPLHIPSGRERIAFGLVGVSLSFPRQVRLRYRLDGIDRDWSQPTTSPEAIYTHLAPGPYRFRVMSSTGDGRWLESDAPVALVVEPAFWQTVWFRLLAVATFFGLAFAAYRLRTRQLTHQLNVRFEERLAERTRIAQELHDTLLQGVMSASMQLHSAVDDLPGDAPNRPEFEHVLNLMSRVSDEGRVAVRGLRTESGDDLEQAFILVRQEYASRNEADFEVTVEGRVRTIHPLIRDEVYRIGREALVNAFRHARATKIEVELEYSFAPPAYADSRRRVRCRREDPARRTRWPLGPARHARARPPHRRPAHALEPCGVGDRGGAPAAGLGRVHAARRNEVMNNEAPTSKDVPSGAIRILTVDDHPFVREGLVTIIGKQPDMAVIAQAGTGQEGIEQFRTHRPDVTLMDLRLPDMSGVDTTIAIRSEFPDGANHRADDVRRRRRHPARLRGRRESYVLKTMPPKDLVEIIRQVHAGKKRVPPEVAALLAEHIAEESLHAARARRAGSRARAGIGTGRSPPSSRFRKIRSRRTSSTSSTSSAPGIGPKR